MEISLVKKAPRGSNEFDFIDCSTTEGWEVLAADKIINGEKVVLDYFPFSDAFYFEDICRHCKYVFMLQLYKDGFEFVKVFLMPDRRQALRR